jgi:hypothetical protein
MQHVRCLTETIPARALALIVHFFIGLQVTVEHAKATNRQIKTPQAGLA